MSVTGIQLDQDVHYSGDSRLASPRLCILHVVLDLYRSRPLFANMLREHVAMGYNAGIREAQLVFREIALELVDDVAADRHRRLVLGMLQDLQT